LEAKIERVAGELASTGPTKQANSDSRTLARYLQAVGVNTTPEHLNDLLVLLAVLMIEAGGGLSLALGMALSGPTKGRTREPKVGRCAEPEHFRTPLPNAPAVQPERPTSTVQPPRDRPSDVVEWLAQQGGRAETSRRRLAAALGRSASAVHDDLRPLAAAGAITMASGPRGTTLALRPN